MRITAAAAAAIMALPSGALAQESPTPRPYFRAGAIAVWPRSADIQFNGTSGTIDYDMGSGGFAAFGVAFDSIRVEAEATYLNVEIDGIDVAGLGPTDIDGDVDLFFGFLNGYLTAPAGKRLEAYGGGGIGVARQRAEIRTVGGMPVDVEEDDTDLAANATAGIEWELPTVSLGARYRFYWVGNGDNGLEGTTAHSGAAMVTVPF